MHAKPFLQLAMPWPDSDSAVAVVASGCAALRRVTAPRRRVDGRRPRCLCPGRLAVQAARFPELKVTELCVGEEIELRKTDLSRGSQTVSLSLRFVCGGVVQSSTYE